MNHNEGNYEPQGVTWLGSTGLRILYRMVETLSVGRFLTWQSSMNPLFLSPVTVLFESLRSVIFIYRPLYGSNVVELLPAILSSTQLMLAAPPSNLAIFTAVPCRLEKNGLTSLVAEPVPLGSPIPANGFCVALINSVLISAIMIAMLGFFGNLDNFFGL